MKTSVIQLNSHQLNRKVREDIILSVKVTKVDILLRSHQTCMSEEALLASDDDSSVLFSRQQNQPTGHTTIKNLFQDGNECKI